MTLKRLVLLFCLVLAVYPTFAQQPVASSSAARDPKALAILQNSMTVMGGAAPSDSSATGTAQIVAGSQATSGSIQVLTRGLAQTLIATTTPSGTRTTIYSNGRANEVTNGVVKVLPLELVVTAQSWYFPLPFVAGLLSDPDTSFQFVDTETLNGSNVYHIQIWDSFSSQPNLQGLANFSLRDIWIDTNSGLPQRISYVRRPAHGAAAGIAVDIYFSSYQNFDGILYPMTIQNSINGTAWATINIQSVALNVGLTDSNFAIQ